MAIDYADVFHSAPAPICVLNQKLRAVDATQCYFRTLNVSREVLIGHYIFDVFPDTLDHKRTLTDMWNRAFGGVASTVPELQYPIPKGAARDELEDRWFSVHSAPLSQGSPPFKAVMFRVDDITETVRLRRLRDVIADETRHRIANMTGLIGAMARQSSKDFDDVPSYADALVARIGTMSRALSLIDGGGWSGTDMATLVDRALAPFEGGDAERISADGPQFTLTVAAAQSVAMGLHELATNATKYGALSEIGGRVHISWHTGADGAFSLEWREIYANHTVQTTSARQGFGTLMLTRLLPMQLGGAAHHELSESGFTYRLSAPADAFAL